MSGPKKKLAAERFFSTIQKQPNGCWLWKGVHFGNKYGQIIDDFGSGTTTHRFSWVLHHGEIPRGKFICHKCDVRNCVNPDHLYVGDHEDNTKDIVDRKRTAKNTGRIRMVERPGELPQNRKLNLENANRMRAEYAEGKFTQMQLAARYGVSQGTVSATIRGVKNMGDGKPKGTPRTGHYRRKLTDEMKTEIRSLYATGKHTQSALAERFGCDQTYISLIVKK